MSVVAAAFKKQPPPLVSFGRGMYLVHICWTKELIPMPRGSHAAVPLGPQLVPVFKLNTVGTGGFAVESAWHAALHTFKVRIPARMLADGTTLSIVVEPGHQNPSKLAKK